MKAPICPECGKPILRVIEIIYEHYNFLPKYGIYHEEERASKMDIECMECGADLGDIFGEGVCNYNQ